MQKKFLFQISIRWNINRSEKYKCSSALSLFSSLLNGKEAKQIRKWFEKRLVTEGIYEQRNNNRYSIPVSRIVSNCYPEATEKFLIKSLPKS